MTHRIDRRPRALRLVRRVALAAATFGLLADPPAELKKKMKARYADLERLRDDGKVGETWNGEVAVVKAGYESEKVDPKSEKSPTIGAFIGTENGDRKQLYALLAKELKTTAAEVAKQNGLRNIDKADPDHWLKLEDGRWISART